MASINDVTRDYKARTYTAGFAFTLNGGYAAKLDTNAFKVVMAGAGDLISGIISEDTTVAIGDPIGLVSQNGDLCAAIAGGAISVGDKVKSDASGKLIATTTLGDIYVGVAESAASSNGFFSLRILRGIVTPVMTNGQATTGTAGTAGQIVVAGMTITGKILVTPAEDPGTNLVLSDVVAGSGIVTVYTKDVTGTPTRAALSGKKVNYQVIALS